MTENIIVNKTRPLNSSLTRSEACEYVTHQLNTFFPDRERLTPLGISKYIGTAFERLRVCFSAFHRKYYCDKDVSKYNHLNGDQNSMFLYILSNTISKANNNQNLADKVYLLNRALNGIDIYHEVNLPDYFLFRHCVGTVLGRATYGDYFSVGQCCTVGNSHGVYPTIGAEVAMYHGAAIIGKCTIGNNCHISTSTIVRDQDIPDNSTVFGISPSLTIKKTQQNVRERFFKTMSASLGTRK